MDGNIAQWIRFKGLEGVIQASLIFIHLTWLGKDASNMDAPFIEEELTKGVHALAKGKDLGPDGLTAKFSKRVGALVVKILQRW